ncbi:NADPH:quinone oxidoreductase [Aeromicrobium sp. A1-2]|uniref:NAD(P)H-quinone oxidoreductase n=1 Tax=Aeromicrobium sp. A1-2 TaxID=2107713 RepID=UPI000E46A2FA|nr:NAD(P)H-quinone oxidoreductase [Aeromicrobium sp. A1-2]AXT86369.1 NADPH:quinone oxidoreductase [Aeromicrobium sp. A1-2]
MRAVIAPDPGGVNALVVVDRPQPVPGPGEVLIRVTAAGINRSDLLQRRGFYPPPEGVTDVLGLECSGDIVAVGEGVTDLPPGTHVCALLAGGGYAEYVAVPAGQVATVPLGVSLVDAGGLMEVACTVWSNVFMMGKLQHGETLLVHGGASGIGTMAIQLGKAFGARVIVTVGSPEKADFCRALGADMTIDYTKHDFAEEMKRANVQADVILDIIGAKYFEANVSALATAGRLVVIGMQGGVKAEINLGALMVKRAAVMATTLRARPSAEKSAIVSAMVAQVWPLISDGTVRPVTHATYPLEDVRLAHQVLEDSSHSGKVLLTT